MEVAKYPWEALFPPDRCQISWKVRVCSRRKAKPYGLRKKKYLCCCLVQGIDRKAQYLSLFGAISWLCWGGTRSSKALGLGSGWFCRAGGLVRLEFWGKFCFFKAFSPLCCVVVGPALSWNLQAAKIPWEAWRRMDKNCFNSPLFLHFLLQKPLIT